MKKLITASDRNYLVISWHRADPRATVRLDGYCVDWWARNQAAVERRRGRVALVVAVEPGQPCPPLPDVLSDAPVAVRSAV